MKSGCNFSKILPTSSRFSIEKQSLLSSSRPHPAVVMDSAEQSPRTVFVTHIIRVCVFLTKPELANPFEIFLAFVEAGLSYDNLVARASPVDADPHLSATKAKKNLFLTSVSILSLRHLARFSHIFAHVFSSRAFNRFSMPGSPLPFPPLHTLQDKNKDTNLRFEAPNLDVF